MASVVVPLVNVTGPPKTSVPSGTPGEVTIAVKVTELPENDGFTLEVRVVTVWPVAWLMV